MFFFYLVGHSQDIISHLMLLFQCLLNSWHASSTVLSLKISKEMEIFYAELAGNLFSLSSDSQVFLIIVHVKFLGGV